MFEYRLIKASKFPYSCIAQTVITLSWKVITFSAYTIKYGSRGVTFGNDIIRKHRI